MKEYNKTISLVKNKRGIWDLDTIKGCKSGMLNSENGCYNDCYAAKTAKRYGIDFYKSIERDFINENHRRQIVKQIERIDMPFIRIGCSGDPSENWEHTLRVIDKIRNESQLSLFDISSKKEIVIITRHWNILNDKQLLSLSKYNLCINTSVSALDTDELITKSLLQYERLKPYCKSVLRVVSAKFNLDNPEGFKRHLIQDALLKKDKVIDTAFRPSNNNPFLLNGIILVEKSRFIKSKTIVSKNNQKVYLGKCKNCKELCGITL